MVACKEEFAERYVELAKNYYSMYEDAEDIPKYSADAVISDLENFEDSAEGYRAEIEDMYDDLDCQERTKEVMKMYLMASELLWYLTGDKKYEEMANLITFVKEALEEG